MHCARGITNDCSYPRLEQGKAQSEIGLLVTWMMDSIKSTSNQGTLGSVCSTVLSIVHQDAYQFTWSMVHKYIFVASENPINVCYVMLKLLKKVITYKIVKVGDNPPLSPDVTDG